MSLANKSQHKKKGNSMTELALEKITKQVCLVCGDKLAPFELETSICIMCED
jgi:hypothetical protein